MYKNFPQNGPKKYLAEKCINKKARKKFFYHIYVNVKKGRVCSEGWVRGRARGKGREGRREGKERVGGYEGGLLSSFSF